MEKYIIQYPDHILKKRSKKVNDLALAKRIVKKMTSIAYRIRSEIYQYPRGFEMAAPQVGEPYSIIILQSDYHKNPRKIKTEALINPEIVYYGEPFYNWEDCLSVYEMRGCVKRFRRIHVSYRDIDGKQYDRKLIRGNSACDIQHGVDHLNGVMYFERAMRYFIPWSVYRPLKEQGFGILNTHVNSTYKHFDPGQYYSSKKMKAFGLIHPRQCLKRSENLYQ